MTQLEIRSLLALVCCTAHIALAADATNDTQASGIGATLQKAATSGDASSEFRYGEWLENDATTKSGEGARAELQEAARWYLLAADQGVAAAQNNLGAMYLDGRGVIQDTGMAQSYYRRAAQQGNAEGETNLALLILRKRIPGDILEGITWLQSAAMHGFAPAQAQLAQIYLDGVLVAPDPARAARLFRDSAEQHYVWGQYGYALALQSGTGTPRNLQDAANWMEKAADQGLPDALFDFATMLEMGLGVPSDKKRANLLIHQAAELGEPRAMVRVAAE